MRIVKFSISLLSMILFLGGCGKGPDEDVTQPALRKVTLQTDWFPQPEHGGFYQALARGYYREAGLEVTILPGGPNAMSTQKILTGRAHFAMNRADYVYTLVARKVPVQMVMATLQHDPQAIMLHASNPIHSLQELGGQTVMAVPGLIWIRWIEARYGISLEIIPHDFGLERFLNDPDFIQQCLLTNEPYYAIQAGVEPRVLPLRDSGFDPYHGIYCLTELIENDPDLVQRFVEASVRGWRDFILNDPAPALDAIAALNPRMDKEFMAYSYHTMRQQNLVTGVAPDGRMVGQLDPQRMEILARELTELDIVNPTDPPGKGSWYTARFLKPGDAPSDVLP